MNISLERFRYSICWLRKMRAFKLALALFAIGSFFSPVLASNGPSPIQNARRETANSARFDALVADAKAIMLVDPEKALVPAHKAELLAKSDSTMDRTVALATAQWLLAEAYLRLNDVDHAKPFIDSAIAAIGNTRSPTKLNGDLLVARGTLHTATADVSAALADYQHAYIIFRNVREVRSQTIALLYIATLYQEAEDYQTALKYYGEALDLDQKDPMLSVSIYNNRGNAFTELKRFKDAEAQFRQALKIARGMGSATLEAQILRNVAREELATGNLDGADRTIVEGFAISRGDDARAARIQFTIVAAQVALERNDLRGAKKLLEQVFSGADLQKTTLSFRDGHQTAFEVFKRLGNDDLALLHLEALKRLDDQTAELAASTNTALMAARFDYTNQNLRIAKLKADELQRSVDYERARVRTVRLIFAGVVTATVIGVSMLVFGLITIRRSRNQVRAANVDLAATNTALAKALAAKTEFLATTSHEIRTPLNGILGMTQVMLADQALSAPMRDRIGIVHGAGVTMRALVDDILDVAKMETGNLTIERAPMDVCAVLRDVARLWQEQAQARGLGFVLELDDCPAFVEGDAARLRQILFNLLANALKFTEAGTITIHAASADDAGAPRVRIMVSDTGIGIPPDKHDEIFESFRQVDAGTTRKFGGTGLGLAICRNLARAMDGDVTVASVVGEGTTFTLDLPLVAVAAPAVAAGDVAAPVGARGLLIVDRNPITRSMVRAVLEPRAGKVDFAASHEEAAERIASGTVALVVIDEATATAAQGNYLAALTVLAETARLAGAALVLLWPKARESERPALLATGIDRVIDKPISGAALLNLLYPTNATNGKDRTDPHLVSRAA